MNTLDDGYTDLPPGKIASVVTFLEMRTRPNLPAISVPSGLSLRKAERPALDWYRNLFRRVGQEWLWFGRLQMNDDELRSVLWDDRVDVFALSANEKDLGMLELDRRVPGEVEIAYFGVCWELLGKGAGRFLLHKALEEAWSHTPQRVWLHTCNLDHPRALEFYQKAGFNPYKFSIEVSTDPRLTGLLPMDAAPQVPIIKG